MNTKVIFNKDAQSPARVLPVQDMSEARGKIGIKHEYKRPGRPKNEEKHLMLPPGFQTLRRGRSEYTEEHAEEFINAFYETGGSLTRACRQTNTKFASVRLWLQTRPEFSTAIQEVQDIIKDEVHSQFMTRVLNEWEPNPAWKFKYFNKNFPEYGDVKKQLKVSLSLKDTLIKPEFIEGEVIRKEITDAIGPKQLLEAPTNSE